jgi:hypothetical protein
MNDGKEYNCTHPYRGLVGFLGKAARAAADHQGLTLVHYSAQRKHILGDTLGASFSPSLSYRGTRGGVTKTAYVELKSGRV